MIIARNKIFSRRDILPKSSWFTENPDIDNDSIKLRIAPSKNKWEKDKNSLSLTEKDIVDKLKKDIKQGYLYEDGPNGGDTHWLKDFSNEESHLMSKFISYENRLNYRIYKPEIEFDPVTGEVNYIIKIILESCLGHGRNGARNYSDIN